MAEDPIIIDDGGSTRIKKHLASGNVGEMDGLLDVDPNVGPPASGRPGSNQETEARGNPYGERITVACIDSAGNHFTPAGFPMAFESFMIESAGHRVDGDVPNPARIRITVSGPLGNDPVVEARQHNGRRRYIVSNSQRISRVTVRRVGGGADLVFDARANSPAGLDVIYTSVIVN